MKVNQFLEVKSVIEAIDTSESYSRHFFLDDKRLIMPLISLELIDEVIGNTTRVRVEFAYFILEGVAYIKWLGQNVQEQTIQGEITLQEKQQVLTEWFAFNGKGEGYELEVNFEDVKLFIPAEARIGNDWWMPWDTPRFKKNIEQSKIDAFFELGLMPRFDSSKMKKLDFTRK